MEEIGGQKERACCLALPHDLQSLPALRTKYKAGGTELELTQSQKMVGQLKKFPLIGLVLLTSRSAVKLSPDGCSSSHTVP